MMTFQPSGPVVASDIVGNFTLLILPQGTLPDELNLSSVSPQGIRIRFAPSQISTREATIIVQTSIAVSKALSPGEYSLTLEAIGGGQTYTQGLKVQVVNYVVYTVGVRFLPMNLTVPAGSTVYWMRLNGAIDDYDFGEHQVHFETANIQSPTFQQYETWSYNFGQVGAFPYHCTYHPYMRGDITVTS